MTPLTAPPARVRKQAGFTLLELMIVVAVGMILVAFSVPQITEALRNYRIAGDARNIKGEVLLAKMRAAARFTRSRVHFDFNARTFQTEIWDKTNTEWVGIAIGAPQVLAQGVNYGVGSMTDPPAGTQALLAQPPPCTDDAAAPGDGADIADTACLYFNSRGFPVDSVGAADPEGAIYITNGNAVEGVTVSINGIARIWRGDASASDYWIRR